MKKEPEQQYYQVNLTGKEVVRIGAWREESKKENIIKGTFIPSGLIVLAVIAYMILFKITHQDIPSLIAAAILCVPGTILLITKQMDYEKAGEKLLKTVQGK